LNGDGMLRAVPVTHLPASTDPGDVAAALERDGVVVVDDVVPASVLEAVEHELAPFVADTDPGTDDFAGRSTVRTGALIARSPSARQLVSHPLALATTKLVLGHATNFQLHLTQRIAIGPGETAQYIHRDQWAFDHFPFPIGYQVQCNTIWAVTPFEERNGATRVVPGSHRFDDGLVLSQGDTEPAEMSPGSVLFYLGSLYHGGGANQTDAVRVGLNITYTVGWLRQEENQYLAVPRDVAAELPVDLLRLMGYARGSYALGYVDDLRDPIEVVRPGASHRGFGVAPTEP
jgi:ectoine hydroxylase-related dioxygenase (phytanoyl-CoA dioxygenase family)